jgi:hypothetical protein
MNTQVFRWLIGNHSISDRAETIVAAAMEETVLEKNPFHLGYVMAPSYLEFVPYLFSMNGSYRLPQILTTH